MFQKTKKTRTQIVDLPEIDVELTDAELRVVSGGLRAGTYGCGSRVVSARGDRTQYNTNGDWDSD